MYQIAPVGADQVCAGAGQPTDAEQQRVKLLGIVGDRAARGARGVQHRQDVARSLAIGIAESLECAEI